MRNKLQLKWVPDWFDLKRYDVMKSAKLEQWASAIIIREWLHKYLSSLDFNRELLGLRELEGYNKLEDVWAKNRRPSESDESIFLDLHMRAIKDVGGCVFSRFDYFPFDKETVRDVSVRQINHLQKKLCERKLLHKDPPRPSKSGVKRRASDHPKRYIDTRVELTAKRIGTDYLENEYGWCLASFDVHAPDELLMQHFKSFISKTRKDLGIEPKVAVYEETDFRRWHSARVLPYIDLLLSFRFTGAKPSLQEVGELLFPEISGIALNDKIRRTTKKYAGVLLSPYTARSIAIQLRTNKV